MKYRSSVIIFVVAVGVIGCGGPTPEEREICNNQCLQASMLPGGVKYDKECVDQCAKDLHESNKKIKEWYKNSFQK